MPEQAYSIHAFLTRHTPPQQITEAPWLLEQQQHTKYPASDRNLILRHAGHKSDKTEPRTVVNPSAIINLQRRMARPERFELPTLCFEGRCSIQLSYGRVVEATLILKHLPLFEK